MLFLLINFIYFYNKNSRKKKYKLSFQRELKYKSYLKYKIHDNNELDISLCITYLYIIFFIILIFMRRVANITTIVDFKIYFKTFLHKCIQTSLSVICLNSLIIICILIIYFFCFSYFYNRYCSKMLSLQLKLDINLQTTHFFNYYLHRKYNLGNHAIKEPIWYKFAYFHVLGLQYIFHRILLLLTILYDLFLNNMVLTHMFVLLPFVFLYELWVKLSIFLAGVNFNKDDLIVKLLYSEISQLAHDKECLYFDDEPHEKTVLREVITDYAKNDFVDKYFLPTNPIREGIKNIVYYWKSVIDKSLEKHKKLDIIFVDIFLAFFFFNLLLKIII